MTEHACPECGRTHVSEAEEQAERELNAKRLKAIRAALRWAIPRAPRPNYTEDEWADYLMGAVAMAALFPDDAMSPDGRLLSGRPVDDAASPAISSASSPDAPTSPSTAGNEVGW